MAYEIPSFYVGVLPADADLTAKQFYGVMAHAASATTGTGVGGAALCLPSAAAASNPMLGILQNAPQLGEAGQVMIHGVSKAVLSDTVAIGDMLMVHSDGTFKKATTGNKAVAQALESGVSGDIAAVLLIRNGDVA